LAAQKWGPRQAKDFLVRKENERPGVATPGENLLLRYRRSHLSWAYKDIQEDRDGTKVEFRRKAQDFLQKNQSALYLFYVAAHNKTPASGAHQ
jgi:hypothetical protein